MGSGGHIKVKDSTDTKLGYSFIEILLKIQRCPVPRVMICHCKFCLIAVHVFIIASFQSFSLAQSLKIGFKPVLLIIKWSGLIAGEPISAVLKLGNLNLGN